MYKIDTGMTVPDSRTKYPFREMEPNDSILFKDKKNADSARVAALRYAKSQQPAWSFTLRRVEDGWRLWRVA